MARFDTSFDATSVEPTTAYELLPAGKYRAQNPRPGDRVEIYSEAFLIQSEPVRDREQLVWTVDLRPA